MLNVEEMFMKKVMGKNRLFKKKSMVLMGLFTLCHIANMSDSSVHAQAPGDVAITGEDLNAFAQAMGLSH